MIYYKGIRKADRTKVTNETTKRLESIGSHDHLYSLGDKKKGRVTSPEELKPFHNVSGEAVQ